MINFKKMVDYYNLGVHMANIFAGLYLCITQMAESCLSYSMKLAYC